MTTDVNSALRVARLIQADPETVFHAWTEPEQLARWSAPAYIRDVTTEVDLRIGGRYRLRMTSPDGQVYTAVGEYREIDRPRRLIYTWSWEESENDVGETLVTVEFHDRGGATEVVVIHELFPTSDATTAHTEGWTSCLHQLEQLFK